MIIKNENTNLATQRIITIYLSKNRSVLKNNIIFVCNNKIEIANTQTRDVVSCNEKLMEFQIGKI